MLFLRNGFNRLDPHQHISGLNRAEVPTDQTHHFPQEIGLLFPLAIIATGIIVPAGQEQNVIILGPNRFYDMRPPGDAASRLGRSATLFNLTRYTRIVSDDD
jgi:hypothetical protein